jgi:GAF domain-containing protein
VCGRLAGADPDRIVADVVGAARDLLGADEASLLTVLPGGRELRECVITGRRPRESFTLRIGAEGVCGWVAQFRKPAIVDDASRDSRYVRADPSHRSMVAVPVLAGAKLLGVLALESSRRGRFRKAQIPELEAVAALLAGALRLGDFAERDAQSEALFGLLNHLTRQIGVLPPDAFLKRVVEAVRTAFEVYYAGIRVGDYAREEVVLVTYSAAGPTPDGPVPRLRFGQGLTGKAFKLGEIVNAREVSKDPFYVAGVPGIRSELCVPIRTGDRCVGILDLQSREPARFGPRDVTVVEAVARIAAPVLAAAIRGGG